MNKTWKRMMIALVLYGAMLTAGWAWTEPTIQDTWYGTDATDRAKYGLYSRAAEQGFSYTPSPADWRDINIYQLFTDRFGFDGTNRLDNYNSSWKCDNVNYPYNRNFHHGGNWRGLQMQLGYLAGMGVNCIWISGVQQNGQGKDTRYTPYHQYHPENFFKCDPAMGTFEDLKALIDDCHSRGIYVILDVVINHMCDKNGRDDNGGYYASWQSYDNGFAWWNSANQHYTPFNNLYYFHPQGTIANWDTEPENKLGQFKGTDDLNTDHDDVQGLLAAAFKNLISATDCDGFRVDAIKHVDYTWCRNWANAMRQHAAALGKSDFIIFGELFVYNSSALASWCSDGYGFNSALFFPMAQTIKGVFGDGNWTGYLGQTMDQVSQFGVGASRLVAFMDNHDLNRIALQVAGTDTTNAKYKLSPALSFLYLATPVPLIYYGTEHMFNQGGHYNGSSTSTDNPDDGDWQRECMFDKGFQPGAASGDKFTESAKSSGMYSHIAWLNNLRKNNISLRRGGFTQRLYTGGQGQYVFTRWYSNQVAVVMLNTADNTISLSEWPNVGLASQTFYENGNTTNGAQLASNASGYLDTSSLTLAGKSTKVYICNPGNFEEAALWAKGTYSYPAEGAATSLDNIYVNTEASATNVADKVEVIWSIDGTNWTTTAMTVNTEWTSASGGNWYSVNLGSFASGGILKYCICVTADSQTFWDNNNSANYSLTVTYVDATDFEFVGTTTDPTTIAAGDEVYVKTVVATNADFTVADIAGVQIVFTEDGGNTWTTNAMTKDAVQSDSRGLSYTYGFGALAGGATIKYFLRGSDTNAVVVYDNNGNVNYSIVVPRDLGNLRMVENTPDMSAETFDLDITGGALQTTSADGEGGGFGDFGSVYVNYDATNIYIGGTGMLMPTDTDANVPLIFVSAGTNSGAENFWYCNSAPEALNGLHNVGFNRPIQCAILLGDIYGDGSHTNFSVYHASGPDAGQGPFATPYNSASVSASFSGMSGALIKQFGAYGYKDDQPLPRQTSSWKCSIPLASLGASGITNLGAVYISGLLINVKAVTNNNTYISGKYMGISCDMVVTNEPLNEYGDIGQSFVYLAGAPFSLGEVKLYDVPMSWITAYGLNQGAGFTETSNHDSDTIPDREEYFLGMDPTKADAFSIEGLILNNDQMQIAKSGTQACSYTVYYADTFVDGNQAWNWKAAPSRTSTNGLIRLPDDLSNSVQRCYFRVGVEVPN